MSFGRRDKRDRVGNRTIRDMRRRLTEKQERFARYYVELGNATEAARQAGYSGDDTALAVRGMEAVRNRQVEARIAELKRDAEIRNELTVDKLAKELSHIAFA